MERNVKKDRKKRLITNIIIAIVVGVLVYLILYLLVFDPFTSRYKRNESLNVHYDLSTDLIPEPKQKDVNEAGIIKNIRGVDVSISKLASYDITGKVEAIQNYNTSSIGSMLSLKGSNVIDYISPIDLTLSWGKIALKENSNHISCNQYYLNRERVVTCFWDGYLKNKYSNEYIQSHVSNNHLICLNNGMRREMNKVKILDIVRIKGYLVKVLTSNNITWGPSSLTRKDKGCEIIYVEDFIIMK